MPLRKPSCRCSRTAGAPPEHLPPSRRLPQPANSAPRVAPVAYVLCLADTVSREPTPAAPFQGHGLRFIRAVTPLRHRTEAVGTLVPVYCYCAGNQYGLSHPNRYRKALGDEPAWLAEDRIRNILDTPYPKAF